MPGLLDRALHHSHRADADRVTHADYEPLETPISRTPTLYVAAMHDPHGFSGAAFVLTDSTGTYKRVQPFALDSETTVNASAYRAVLLALDYALHAGLADPAEPLELLSHHQIVVRQLQGAYALHAPALRVLHDEAQTIAGHFAAISYEWIPKSANPAAVLLSKTILGASQ